MPTHEEAAEAKEAEEKKRVAAERRAEREQEKKEALDADPNEYGYGRGY